MNNKPIRWLKMIFKMNITNFFVRVTFFLTGIIGPGSNPIAFRSSNCRSCNCLASNNCLVVRLLLAAQVFIWLVNTFSQLNGLKHNGHRVAVWTLSFCGLKNDDSIDGWFTMMLVLFDLILEALLLDLNNFFLAFSGSNLNTFNDARGTGLAFGDLKSLKLSSLLALGDLKSFKLSSLLGESVESSLSPFTFLKDSLEDWVNSSCELRRIKILSFVKNRVNNSHKKILKGKE